MVPASDHSPVDRWPVADLSVEELAGAPYDLLAELRRSTAVVWIPALDGWLVTSRQLALEVMRDPGRFTVDDPRFSTAQVVGTSMLSLDGAEHSRHRNPFVDHFRAGRVVKEFGQWLRVECERRVDVLVGEGRAELRTQLAGPVAVAAISRALGLTGVDPTDLLAWYRSIVTAVVDLTEGGVVSPSGHEAVRRLRGAVLETATSGSGSWLQDIRDARTLNDHELAANTAVMLFGAIETSEGATTNALWHVLSDPIWPTWLREDPDLIAGAVEESLRLEPAAAVIDRYAVGPTTLGGVEIGDGDLVRLSLLAANRDPAKFDDPDRFDPRRRNSNRHLTFASGPHACFGMHLARLEANETLRAVVMSPSAVRLIEDGTTAPSGLVFRKPDTVAVRW